MRCLWARGNAEVGGSVLEPLRLQQIDEFVVCAPGVTLELYRHQMLHVGETCTLHQGLQPIA